MPDRPQVPRTAQLLGPAIDAWVKARPGVLPFLNLGAGRYADIIAGWEAQCALLVRQIADEVASARLASAQGVALTQVAASEFRTLRNVGPNFAIGRAVLGRSGGLPGGVIRKGFRFSRTSLPANSPPVPAGAYVATRDVSYAQGVSSISVPIASSLAGAAANAPYYDADNTAGGAAALKLQDTPFDGSISVTGFEAAGGSDGESDDDLRAQSLANASGDLGPTLSAILAGALSGVGVHRVACFDIAQAADGTPCAYTGVAIADASWSSGFPGLPPNGAFPGGGVWEGRVGQIIADGFQGVGGQVLVTGINNRLISVAPTINLRSGDDLKDTSDIDTAVLAAVRSYFDNRPDFYTWTANGLRAWVSRCHAKILSCSGVVVKDLVTGAPLAAPMNQPAATEAGIDVSHFFVVQNGVAPLYQAAA